MRPCETVTRKRKKNRMKHFLLLVLISLIFASCEKSTSQTSNLKNGDLIFQTSLSSQSKAIQVATHSEYSHCGIIYIESGKSYVFEAVQPVKLTPLKDWIERGKNGHYVVKRLKDESHINKPENLKKLKHVGESFKGKSYDLTFEWSDEKIYCSELIYKIYDRALNIQIGKLQTLKSFDLSNSIVREKMKERYGKNIPMNEKVISPKSIFESNLLKTVIVK